jgi:hypothetical protein
VASSRSLRAQGASGGALLFTRATLAALAALACSRTEPAPPAAATAEASASAGPGSDPSAAPAPTGTLPTSTAPAAASNGRVAEPSVPVPAAPVTTSATSFGCAVLEPARALPFVGPSTLVWEAGESRGRPTVVFNSDGTPERVSGPVSLGDAPAQPTSSPACAAAPPFLYCLGGNGEVLRYGPEGPAASVARARARTSLAAAPLGGRVLLAYLAESVTSEGIILVARIGYDGSPPLVLSEEGSGATYVTLAPWADKVLAVYADERSAMTPVHARVVKVGPKAGYPALGPDAVIFVGDGGARTQTAVARAEEGKAFALVPSTRDDRSFGLAAVHLSDPPEVDAKAHWSPYPAALTPAAVVTPRLSSAPVALRVRPSAPEPSAKKVLELGRITPSGAFEQPCAIAEGQTLQDLAVEVDAEGTTWLAYTKGARTYLERRGRVPGGGKP